MSVEFRNIPLPTSVETDTSTLFADEMATRNAKSTIAPLSAPRTNMSGDDFAGDSSTSGTIAIGGTSTGTIDFDGDRDWFRFNAQAGDLVHFGLENENFLLMNIGLVDSNDLTLLSNDTRFGLDYQFTQAGTFYIDISELETGFTPFDYTLTAVADDFAGDTSTSGTLTIDGTATAGSIDYLDGQGDADWFAVDIVAGETVFFDLSDGEFEMGIRDQNGNFVDQFSGGESFQVGLGQDFNFAATVTQTFYIQVDATRAINTGDYTVSATSLSDDVAGNETTTALANVNGAPIVSQIDFAGDRDWYKFTVAAGSTIDFILADGFVDLEVIDPDENFGIIRSGDTYTFNNSGTYYLQVTGQFADNDPVAYTINATGIVDDFGSTVQTAGAIAVGTTVNGNLDFATDVDVFSFQATAGQFFRVTIDGDSFFRDPNATFVRDINNNINYSQVGGETIGPNSYSLVYQVFADDTYFVAVDSPSNQLTNYALALTEIFDDSSNIDDGATAIIADSRTLSGSFEYGNDTDVYTFTTETDNQLVALKFSELGGDNSVTFDVRVSDQNSTVFENGFIQVGDEIFAKLGAAGTYFVAFTNGTNDIIDYTFSAEVLDEPFAADTTTAGVLPLNDDIAAALETQFDEDWFALDVAAGQDVLIAAFSVGASLEQPRIDLYDSVGTLINVTPNERIEDGVIEYIFAQAGTYYIGVTGLFTDITGEYTLSTLTIDAGDIVGTIAAETLSGTEGADIIKAVSGNDTVNANGGDDIVYAGLDDDTVRGGAGNDQLFGGGGNDNLVGGNGNDILTGGQGADILNGGNGIDRASYETSSRRVTVDLAAGTGNGADADGDTFTDVEDIDGTFYDDDISGDALANRLDGLDGDDRLIGNDGNDMLFGRNGDDIIFGGGQQDLIFGGSGNDQLSGDNGRDTISGDAGSDTIDGGGSGDILMGGNADDLISGGDGNDKLFGDDDNDTLSGQQGKDTLRGGTGDDILYGDDAPGSTTGDVARDFLFGGTGNDFLSGGDGNDILRGGGQNDLLIGGKDNDNLFGDNGDDTLDGSSGNDTLRGGGRNDQLSGGAQDDFLFGGSGVDVLNGGKGDDFLRGDSGRDLFVFEDGFGSDEIADFDALASLEKIDLSAVTSITDFTDLITNHIDTSSGVVRIVDGANSITLTGVNLADLDANDFVF